MAQAVVEVAVQQNLAAHFKDYEVGYECIGTSWPKSDLILVRVVGPVVSIMHYLTWVHDMNREEMLQVMVFNDGEEHEFERRLLARG